MVAKVSLGEELLQQLQQAGELRVEDALGVPVVLMTPDARQQLEKLAYDDSEWTDAEQNALMAEALDDPGGWGAPGMEVYDELYGSDFQAHGENQ
jgi:hypothetical protein